MRVVYLAAGAAGMYCGSCIRDNRLAATLLAQGRDISLVPLYTPMRTDEPDVSGQRVYYGGINVYLQQRSSFFRRAPRFIDALLDSPRLLSSVGRRAAKTRPEGLGALTVSVLRGGEGPQRKALRHLIDGLRRLGADAVNLPNLMFTGTATEIRRELKIPVFCTLSGEDVFLDQLPEPSRGQAFELIARHADTIDAFLASTRYCADHSVAHFGLPPERVHAIPLGVAFDYPQRASEPPSPPLTIGYLARVCPEKGLHELAEAFVALRRKGRDCRLLAAGYLGAGDRAYLAEIEQLLRDAGCADAFEYRGEVTRDQKLALLAEAHLFCLPTTFAEAKGLPVLEALGVGVPVVLPRSGSFPELVEETGGGLLYDPGEADGLVATLGRLLDDAQLRRELGQRGCRAVRERFNDQVMAEQTWRIYERYVDRTARTS